MWGQLVLIGLFHTKELASTICYYGDSPMSILKVDTINEKTSGNGVQIPGHVIQTINTATPLIQVFII